MRQVFMTMIAVSAPLLLAACQPVTNDAGDDARVVTVSGEGEVSVAPEIATVHLGIEARDRELSHAQAKAGEVVGAVLELVESLGIPGSQVQSTQLNVRPEFEWNDGRQAFRGYLVQRDITVELEKLDRLGPLLERAMATGVNSVSPPELGVKNPRELHREALQRAAADAKASALALAETLGATLGAVHAIRAIQDAPPMPLGEARMMRMSADSGAAEQTYETGRILVRARVQAEFELE